MTYIISCSGDKSCLSSENTQKSTINDLNGFSALLQARIELIEKLGIDLNWSETLPAYKLYTGRLYKKVKQENWEKQKSDIVIVSALFGLLKHDELIPNYNVVMTDLIPGSKDIISTYWRGKNLNSYINSKIDVDLLFSKYRKAFNKEGSNIGIIPNVIWRDKYGSHKGEWLNQQLNIL
jgi:cytoplasmic iron level regulating protein YaaA (DUF328/UPF0246 family)